MTDENPRDQLMALGLTSYVGKHPTSPARREEARRRLPELEAAHAEIRRRIEEHFGEERRRLEREVRQARTAADAYQFTAQHRRGSETTIVARGDSWEDVLRQVEKRRKGASERE